MSRGGVRTAWLWAATGGTAALCAAWIGLAASLHRQQNEIAHELQIQIDDALAATGLNESVENLALMLRVGAREVAPLHERVAADLEKVRSAADDDEGRRRAAEAAARFQEHLGRWAADSAPSKGVVAELERGLRQAARDLVAAAQERIDRTANEHRLVLRRLAQGVAGIGLLGTGAGLLFGYGVSRWTRRAIQRLQVRVQATADKLGGPPSEIEITGVGDVAALDQQLRVVAHRIEDVVARLQQRDRDLQRAEQLAAVGRLAAGVAHEIRNPLTSVKLLLQAGKAPDGALGPGDLEIAEGEILRIERSLQSFLDFARPPALERRPLDVAELLARTAALVRGRAERQHVRTVLDAPAPVPIAGDREQLQQVFVNLALNALDAMPTGGTLDLRCRAGDEAEIGFADTGPGIPAAMQPRLFEAFASSKETGLGLGLAISARIVESHGGRLTGGNAPAPARGAVFEVRLPLAERPAPAVEARHAALAAG